MATWIARVQRGFRAGSTKRWCRRTVWQALIGVLDPASTTKQQIAFHQLGMQRFMKLELMEQGLARLFVDDSSRVITPHFKPPPETARPRRAVV